MLPYLHRLLAICALLHYVSAQRAFQQPPRRPAAPAPGNSLAGSDILAQVSEVNPDGSFYTKWQTANGISYEEQGQLKNPGTAAEAEQVQGSASWTSKDGQPLSITWQADENGAVFYGDHLPTPPPTPAIPPLIQRALDWIAANPSKYDNNEGKYEEGPAKPAPQLLARKPAAPRRF